MFIFAQPEPPHGNRSSGVQYLILPFLSTRKAHLHWNWLLTIYHNGQIGGFAQHCQRMHFLFDSARDASRLGYACQQRITVCRGPDKVLNFEAWIECRLPRFIDNVCSTVGNVLERVQNVASIQVGMIFSDAPAGLVEKLHLTLFTGIYPFYGESCIARVKSRAAFRQSRTKSILKKNVNRIHWFSLDWCLLRAAFLIKHQRSGIGTKHFCHNTANMKLNTSPYRRRSAIAIHHSQRFERFLSQHSWHLHHKCAIRTILLARLTGLVGVFHRLGHRSLFVCISSLIL